MGKIAVVLAVVMAICRLAFGADISGMTYTVHADRNSASNIYSDSEIGLYGISDYEAASLDTGINLVEGDIIKITATGTWGNASWVLFGVEGNRYEDIAVGYPGAGLPVAALIGRVGGSRWFYIGVGSEWTENTGGHLVLAFNDTDYGNNWGSARVTVSVDSIEFSDYQQVRMDFDSCQNEYDLLEIEIDRLQMEIGILNDYIEVLDSDLSGLLEFVKTPPGVRKQTYFEPQSGIAREIKEALLPKLEYGRYAVK